MTYDDDMNIIRQVHKNVLENISFFNDPDNWETLYDYKGLLRVRRFKGMESPEIISVQQNHREVNFDKIDQNWNFRDRWAPLGQSRLYSIPVQIGSIPKTLNEVDYSEAITLLVFFKE